MMMPGHDRWLGIHVRMTRKILIVLRDEFAPEHRDY
ncbi:hypothetical protein RHIZ404_140007 [Rhizobium sp. EC-SD404]|nr:hypothetical protein RHIZ404_140007 [Rhizobium sp. EC-SD404]